MMMIYEESDTNKPALTPNVQEGQASLSRSTV
jgi:hypothetical protein